MTRDTATAAPVAAPRTKKIRNAAPAPPAAPPVLQSPSAEIPPPLYLRREKKGKKAPKPPVPEKPVALDAKNSFDELETKPEGFNSENLQENAPGESRSAVENAPEQPAAVAVDELQADDEAVVDSESTADEPEASDNLETSSPPEEPSGVEVVKCETEIVEEQMKWLPPKIIDEIFKSSQAESSEEKGMEIAAEILSKPSEDVVDLDLPKYAFLSNPAPPIPAPLKPCPVPSLVQPKSIFKFYTPSKFHPRCVDSSGAFKVKPIDFGPGKARESTCSALEEPAEEETTPAEVACKNLLRFDSLDEGDAGFDGAVCEKAADLLAELAPEASGLQSPLQICVEVSPGEDLFEQHGPAAFSVAAISPRESSQGVESIHQNFNNFTKHMLANDYVLIERTGKEEQSESAKCDTIPEESPAFEVDWGNFACDEKQETAPTEENSNETPWPLSDHMTTDDGKIAPSDNDAGEFAEALEASAISKDEEDEKNCDDVMETKLFDQNIICDREDEENERLCVSDDEAAADLAAATQEVPAGGSIERDVNLEKSWGVLGLRLEVIGYI